MENEVVNRAPPAPEEPKQSWSVLQVLKRRQFEVEVLLELVIILLIGFEIVLGIYFHRADTEASNEQTRLLQEAHSQAQRHAQILKSIADEQNQALRSMIRMSDVLQAQLAILDAEQTRRLEELEQKPRLQLLVKGVVVPTHSAARSVPLTELTSDRAVIELTLRNYGQLYAQAVEVSATPSRAEVQLDCRFARDPTAGGTIRQSGRGCLISFDFIGHEWLENVSLIASYPNGTGPFKVSFAMWATNYPKRNIGSIQIKPPTMAESSNAQAH